MDELHIPDTFNDQEKALAKMVHEWHYPQVRKYTQDPYSTHLMRVAALVQKHTNNKVLVATALCHDILEDTTTTKEELLTALLAIGYLPKEASSIIKHVLELTDIYTKENHPNKNRAERKALETERLLHISPAAATVKFADLIDNIQDIIPYDKGFAKVYIRETIPLLSLTSSFPTLQQLAKTNYDNLLQQFT